MLGVGGRANPENARLHRVNAALNNLELRQTICEAAVSEFDGIATLHEAMDNWAHTTSLQVKPNTA